MRLPTTTKKKNTARNGVNLPLFLLITVLLAIAAIHKQSNYLNMTMSYMTTTTTNEQEITKFDVISKRLFEKAIAPPKTVGNENANDNANGTGNGNGNNANGNNGNPRKPFVLDSNWVRGKGGLDDADRQTIGDLYFNASSVFEFGLGESTLIAAAVNVPRYAGVDSDAVWVSKARETAIASGMHHFRFYFGDIGETKSWGFPAISDLAKNEYDYQLAALMSEPRAFDVYLVDGRYRVACACLSFLHAIKHGSDGDLSKVRVGIHDNDRNHIQGMNNMGRHYEVLQEVADVEIQNNRLWVYKLKSTITADERRNIEQELFDLWERIHEDYW